MSVNAISPYELVVRELIIADTLLNMMTACFRDKVLFGDVICSQSVAVTDSENELSRPKVHVAPELTQTAVIGVPRATSTQICVTGNCIEI